MSIRAVVLRGVTWRSLGLIGCETLVIFACVYAAAVFRFGLDDAYTGGNGLWKAGLIALVTQVSLYFADLYDLRVIADRRELFVGAVQSLGATCMILAGLYYWFPDLVVGRGVLAYSTGLIVLLVFGWRLLFEWAMRKIGPRDRLLLVGTSEGAVRLARELHERRDLAVAIVGFIDPDPGRIGSPVFNPGVIGTIEDIPAIVRARSVDQVVVSLSDARGKLPMDKLLDMKLEGVQFEHLASVYEKYTGKIAVENLRPSWLIFSDGFRKSRLQHVAKRVTDLVLSALGLIVAAPLMIVAASAVKVTSRGPILYRQQRVGLHGRVFQAYKFRSMQQDAEKETGAVWATRNDTRVTRVGRLMRQTRIDELPQLWNILCGHMSLVGPRPERPEFVSELTRQIPFYGQRHTVRPGLTGWAQVRYTYGASVEDAMEKLQYDLFYIKNMSLALDLFIITKTIKTVLMRKGAQ